MDETTTRRCYMAEELRVVEPEGNAGRPKIVGLAVPYRALSEDLGGFREQFMPGSLGGSIASRDVFADVEHDRDRKLGRTSKGTLSLKESRKGIMAEITIPDTTVGRDTLEEVRNGSLDAMSIVFSDPEDQYSGKAGAIVRNIDKAELMAVTLTSYPAYRQTAGSLAQRSLEEYRSTIGEPLLDQNGEPIPELTGDGVEKPLGVFVADTDTEEINRLQDRAELDPASY